MSAGAGHTDPSASGGSSNSKGIVMFALTHGYFDQDNDRADEPEDADELPVEEKD